MGMNEWRSGGHYPGLILKISEKDFDRVGACWMKGRLKVNDLVMAIAHSGDCFWTYMLVDDRYTSAKNQRLYFLIKESSFGAYVLGTHYTVQPSEREFHLLMAGEKIPLLDKAL